MSVYWFVSVKINAQALLSGWESRGKRKESKSFFNQCWFLMLFLSVSFRATRKDPGKITWLLLVCSQNWSRVTLWPSNAPWSMDSQGTAQKRDLHLKLGLWRSYFVRFSSPSSSMPFPACNLQIKVDFKVCNDSNFALFFSTFRKSCLEDLNGN